LGSLHEDLLLAGSAMVPLRAGNLLLGGFLGAALASGILVTLGLGASTMPGWTSFARA
jgi:hypothetical protein